MTTAVRTCAASACAFNAESSLQRPGHHRRRLRPHARLRHLRPAGRPPPGDRGHLDRRCVPPPRGTYNADLACTAEGIEVTDVATRATYTRC